MKKLVELLFTLVNLQKKMSFKIDTKEKFHVITLSETHISDIMATELENACLPVLQTAMKNVILNLSNVTGIDKGVTRTIVELQQLFYESNASFVVCHLSPTIEAAFEEDELADFLNQTPTESEAWDIVQMEEIERELLDGDNFSFKE